MSNRAPNRREHRRYGQHQNNECRGAAPAPGLPRLAAILLITLSLVIAGGAAGPVVRADGDLVVAGETGAAALDEQLIDRARGLSNAFRAVAELVSPGVVRIEGLTGAGVVTGSGFVIRSDGYIVTNNHVVEGTANLLVEFAGGARYSATLIGADPLTDLAVVKVERDGLTPLRLDAGDDLQVGDWVVAIGFPLGLEQTVTAGIVSATNRRLNIVGSSVGRRGYEDFIQTDAAINRGNSGGPLVDLTGEVVGLNSAIVTRTGGSDGLGFAIPASLVDYITGEIIAHGRVIRGFLGVDLQELTPALARSYGLDHARTGVLLTEVSGELPAGKAGLAAEDIVLAIDNRPVLNVEDLRNRIAMSHPGTRIELEVFRDGQYRVVPVTLDEMHVAPQVEAHLAPDAGGRLGFMLSDGLVAGRPAVFVRNVILGGSAYLAGFEDGDIIIAINGLPLQTLPTRRGHSAAIWLDRLIDEASPGEILRFTVRRELSGDSWGTRYVGIETPA